MLRTIVLCRVYLLRRHLERVVADAGEVQTRGWWMGGSGRVGRAGWGRAGGGGAGPGRVGPGGAGWGRERGMGDEWRQASEVYNAFRWYIMPSDGI